MQDEDEDGYLLTLLLCFGEGGSGSPRLNVALLQGGAMGFLKGAGGSVWVTHTLGLRFFLLSSISSTLYEIKQKVDCPYINCPYINLSQKFIYTNPIKSLQSLRKSRDQ